MPPDPNKVAELNALAQGGSAGLAQWQQANQAAQQAQSNAVGQASNYGSANYHTSGQLQSTLGGIASSMAAPGVNAAAAGAAAEPGLDALGQAASDTYLSRNNQQIQSKLAETKARLDLQRQADQADQQTKLAELGLQRDEMNAKNQYELGQLDVDKMKLALSPTNIAGQALADQKQAVGDANNARFDSAVGGGLEAAGGDLLSMFRSAVHEGQKSDYEKGQAAVEGQTKTNDVLRQQGQLRPEDEQYLQSLQQNLASLTRPQDEAQWQAGMDEQRRLADQQNEANAAAAHGAAQLQQFAALDLPRFQYNAAVDRGMDPTAAAGKFLANEDQSIYEKRLQGYNQENLDDTLAARSATREAAQQRRDDAAKAADLADKVGIPANVLANAATATRMPFDNVSKLLTSDAWKKVDEIRSHLGSKDASGNVFGGQEFANALLLAQNDGSIDPNAADLAMYLYSPDARLASQAAAYQNSNP